MWNEEWGNHWLRCWSVQQRSLLFLPVVEFNQDRPRRKREFDYRQLRARGSNAAAKSRHLITDQLLAKPQRAALSCKLGQSSKLRPPRDIFYERTVEPGLGRRSWPSVHKTNSGTTQTPDYAIPCQSAASYYHCFKLILLSI